jgi:thiol:disulfide interchange protein
MKAWPRWLPALVIGLLLVAAGTYKLGPRFYNTYRYRQLMGRHVYDRKADARALFDRALAQANQQHKPLLVVFGGDWCQWCLALDDLMHQNAKLRDYAAEHYVVLKLDSEAARPLDDSWGQPSHRGVPVLIFVDQKGAPVHVQETISLELWHGKLLGHDPDKVLELLKRFG